MTSAIVVPFRPEFFSGLNFATVYGKLRVQSVNLVDLEHAVSSGSNHLLGFLVSPSLRNPTLFF